MPPFSVAQSNKPPFEIGKTLNLAKHEKRNGNVAMAAYHFGQVLRRFPGNQPARNGVRKLGPKTVSALIANARRLQAKDQLDEAEKFWACAVALNPDHSGLGLSLARCRVDLGRNHAALRAVERVLDRNPDAAEALDTKGRILRDLGRADEAEACHRASLGRGIADAGPLNHLGILAQSHGDNDTAAQFFRQAISLRPDVPDLHHNLSRSMSYRDGEQHLTQMQEISAASGTQDPTVAPLHFALFNAYDQLGDVEQAFAHLSAGNRLRKSETRYDIRKEALRFSWFKSLFAKPVDPIKVHRQCQPRPVFVVGLPRSGTTLAERVISGADGTQPAGELSVVSNAVAPMLRQLERDGRVEPTPDDIQALRTRLLSGLTRYSDGSATIIDKMPLNFRWVGFICAALPEARIVSLSRDPMAVGWSLYRHLFAGRGNGFAYDLGDIAAYLLLHRDLMQFWSARFQSQIIPLSYTELITDTEPTIRRLIAGCDLLWSDTCLAPREAKTAVRTASSAQVQKAIYQNSDRSWRKYQLFLEPLAEGLRAAGLADSSKNTFPKA